MLKTPKPPVTFGLGSGAALCDENPEGNRLDVLAEAEDLLSDSSPYGDSSATFNDSLHSDVSDPYETPPEPLDSAPAVPIQPQPDSEPPPGMQVSDPSQSGGQILITTVDSLAIVDRAATSRSSPRESAYPQEAVEFAMRLFLETGEYPPEGLIPAVRALLRSHVMAAIVREDYDEAALLKEAELKLSTDWIEERKQAEEHKIKLQSVEERIATVSQKLAEVRSSWSQKMEEFENEKTARLSEMRARHEHELDDLEAHWNDSSTLLAFNKASTQLILIRKQQRMSALASEFARAKELKRRGDELERIETAEAERKATESMRAARGNLKRRQQRELAHAQMNWQRQWQTLESERDAEIQQTELCLRQLDAKSTACIAAKGRVAPVVSKPNTGTVRTSPRVRKKSSQLKDTRQQQQVALMGFRVARKEQPRRKVSCRRP
jgi:hypothetical protein